MHNEKRRTGSHSGNWTAKPPLPMGRKGTSCKYIRSGPDAKLHSAWKTRPQDERKRRTAWSKTPEGQTGLRSLGLKSTLVPGSLKVTASSSLRWTCDAFPLIERQVLLQSTAESEEVLEKLAELHDGTVLLLLERPEEEPRASPSKTKNDQDTMVSERAGQQLVLPDSRSSAQSPWPTAQLHGATPRLCTSEGHLRCLLLSPPRSGFSSPWLQWAQMTWRSNWKKNFPNREKPCLQY